MTRGAPSAKEWTTGDTMARSAAPKEDEDEGASLVVHYMADDDGLTVDEALTLAGGWSHYQHKLILTLGCVQAASSSHMLAPIFLIPRLTADWQLTAGQASLLSSLFFAGYCVGVVVWSWFSDSYGRRPGDSTGFWAWQSLRCRVLPRAKLHHVCAPSFSVRRWHRGRQEWSLHARYRVCAAVRTRARRCLGELCVAMWPFIPRLLRVAPPRLGLEIPHFHLRARDARPAACSQASCPNHRASLSSQRSQSAQSRRCSQSSTRMGGSRPSRSPYADRQRREPPHPPHPPPPPLQATIALRSFGRPQRAA